MIKTNRIQSSYLFKTLNRKKSKPLFLLLKLTATEMGKLKPHRPYVYIHISSFPQLEGPGTVSQSTRLLNPQPQFVR